MRCEWLIFGLLFSTLISMLSKGERASHEFSALFFTRGRFKVDIQCRNEPKFGQLPSSSSALPSNNDTHHVYKFIPSIEITVNWNLVKLCVCYAKSDKLKRRTENLLLLLILSGFVQDFYFEIKDSWAWMCGKRKLRQILKVRGQFSLSVLQLWIIQVFFSCFMAYLIPTLIESHRTYSCIPSCYVSNRSKLTCWLS